MKKEIETSYKEYPPTLKDRLTRVQKHRLENNKLSVEKKQDLFKRLGLKKVADKTYICPVSGNEIDIYQATRECFGALSRRYCYLRFRFLRGELSQKTIENTLLKFGYVIKNDEVWIKI